MLAESGYSREELDAIWRYEVAPECLGNFYQVAGDWDAIRLDEAALIERAARRPGILARGLGRVPLLIVSGHYAQILELRERLLLVPVEVRSQLATAWSAFARVYVEDDPRPGVGRVIHGSGIPGTALSKERCEETFEADFRPVYRRLLLLGERPSEKARARRVREFIARAFA
ncbi:MAG: hypothetical protein ABI054_07265 [Planctomycetota bacterium]